MKKYIYPLLVAIALPCIFSSCIKNDDAVELSENCYISDFTLGQLKRTMYMKTTAGMDSIYTTAFAGSYYPLTIDQRALIIENKDSLPTRTRLDHVLTTVTFDGALFWRKAQLSAEDDTTWNAYNVKDSLDLSAPLHFRVFSSSGQSHRTYTLKINVHQQPADSTTWHHVGDTPLLTNVGQRKVLAWHDKLMIWGKKSDGTLVCLQHALQNQGEWTSTATTGTDGAQPITMQVRNDTLYMTNSDGAVITSIDGTIWTVAPHPALNGLKLVAASNDYLYALQGQKLMCSNGGAWVEETLDDENTNLPTEELNSVFYYTRNGMERLMIFGSRNATDNYATIWCKTWEYGREAHEGWMYYTPNAADKHHCPMFENLCIVPYDDGLQALGGRSRDRKYEALDSIFHSMDHGITWGTYDDNDMLVDPELRTAAQGATHISAAMDDENHLWVIIDDKVWRGRINRLGFLRQDKE